jgi:Fe2+ transport system protein B
VLYTPCISSFFTLLKELGTKAAMKIIGLVFITAILATAVLHTLYSLLF